MSLPESMSREEMLELAQLDALGLLDEFESQAFNRYFHRATAPPPRKRLYLQVRCSGITHLWIWHVGDWDLLIASVVQRVIAGEMCRNCAGNFFIEILRLEVPDHAASFELAMRFARAMEQKMSDGSCAGK